MLPRILVLVAAAGVLATLLFLSQSRSEPLKVSGFIEADEIRVGSRIGGRVARVHVAEGQVVRAGDVLVELEPFDLGERRAQAQALFEQSKAEHTRLARGFRPEEIAEAKARRDQLAANLERLVKGPRAQELAAARARCALAEAQLTLAQQEHERAKSLQESGISGVAALERLTSELRVAESTLTVRRQELALLEEGTRAEEIAQAKAQLAEADAMWQLRQNGYREEDIAAAAAAVAAAEASVQVIVRQLEETRVRAPIDAIVEAVELRAGDLVAANAPVLSLLDAKKLWVRAWVPENRLVVRPGQVLLVGVDSYPGERFRGRVGFISRVAEFTPGNVQTPEERSKQVFRIKVDLEEGLDRLRAGMAADVWLDEVPER